MNLSFVFMASGFGKRFGANKLYVPLEGKPLYRHGLECLMETAVRLRQEDGHQVRLVVVSQYRKILEDGERLGLETVLRGLRHPCGWGQRRGERTGIYSSSLWLTSPI